MMDTTQMLTAMYADFNARDAERVLARLHADVAWPNGWEGGTVDGHAAIRDYWTRQWAAIDPIVIPESFSPLPDGRLRVGVHQRVQSKAGVLLSDERLSHTYTLRDGLISRMEIGAA